VQQPEMIRLGILITQSLEIFGYMGEEYGCLFKEWILKHDAGNRENLFQIAVQYQNLDEYDLVEEVWFSLYQMFEPLIVAFVNMKLEECDEEEVDLETETTEFLKELEVYFERGDSGEVSIGRVGVRHSSEE
jgi:hypothetical protein